METIISVHPEELTEDFLHRVKAMAVGASRVRIKFETEETNPNGISTEELLARRAAFESGHTISFSMPELKQYIDKNFSVE